MNLEDRCFTRARLGKHWTEERAIKCLEFFNEVPYNFNAKKERDFMASHLTDYNYHLKNQLKLAEEHDHRTDPS